MSEINREEAEKIAMILNELVAEKLHVSPLAIVFIRIIILTFLGLAYDQNTYEVISLSISTIEDFKEQLEI